MQRELDLLDRRQPDDVEVVLVDVVGLHGRVELFKRGDGVGLDLVQQDPDRLGVEVPAELNQSPSKETEIGTRTKSASNKHGHTAEHVEHVEHATPARGGVV